MHVAVSFLIVWIGWWHNFEIADPDEEWSFGETRREREMNY
jgi:hypothetical protein